MPILPMARAAALVPPACPSPIPTPASSISKPAPSLSPGSVGELAVRGPQVMQGYCGPGAPGLRRLEEGWLFTGDAGVRDEAGFFHILGRKTDIVQVNGAVVYPRDVEEALYEHSRVQDVAVVGVTGGDGEQWLKAVIVPQAGAALTGEELRAFCQRRWNRLPSRPCSSSAMPYPARPMGRLCGGSWRGRGRGSEGERGRGGEEGLPPGCSARPGPRRR